MSSKNSGRTIEWLAYLATAVIAIVALIGIFGCVNTPVDVLAVACDSQQTYKAERCAKALVDTYTTVYQQRAVEAMQNPKLSDSDRAAIADAESTVTQAILEVNRLNRTFIQTKELLARKPDPTASEQELAIQQEAMLNDLVKLTAPKINQLIALIELEARK